MGFKKKFPKYRNKHEKRKSDKVFSPKNQERSYQPKVQLREDQVGIEEYVNGGPGITGIFKSRFSDFHVNEIDLNGKVLHLTTLDVPQPLKKELDEETLKKLKEDVSGIVPENFWSNLTSLSREKKSDSNKPIEFNVNSVDKESRTKIHHIIKDIYNTTLVSTTTNEPGTENRIIRVLRRKGSRNESGRNDWNFPGQYVHFLVYKENMDTVEAASTMATRLGANPSNITYCGTKDKRAKTTQKFCIKKRCPSQLVNAVKDLGSIHIGNFDFCDNPLRLGDLKGNKFRIALRHIDGVDEDMESILQKVKENGFINYYGLQRFGNCASIPTYEIGIALLKSDFKLACELILKPRDNDLDFLRSIREFWWEKRDSKAAADMIRGDKFIEKQLLLGLAKNGEKNYVTAIRKIPRNALLLYIHAFQSFIFNRIASKRIKQFGLKVMPGDLVFKDEITEVEMINIDTKETAVEADPLKEETNKDKETDAPKDEDKSATKKAQQETTDKEMPTTAIGVGSDDDNDDDDDDDETETLSKKAKIDSEDDSLTESKNDENPIISSFKDKVKALTNEDIESGKYTIFDVVLPLPGFDITYPSNEVGKWYEELLNEYDLTSEKMRHHVKTFSMPGAYRKMVIKPIDMSWEFKEYKSPEETLFYSDWDTLKATFPKYKKKKSDECSESQEATASFRALLLTLSLPSSCYATMLLREILKADTSPSNQAQLEKMHTEKRSETEEKESPSKNGVSEEQKTDQKKKNDLKDDSLKEAALDIAVADEDETKAKKDSKDDTLKEKNNDEMAATDIAVGGEAETKAKKDSKDDSLKEKKNDEKAATDIVVGGDDEIEPATKKSKVDSKDDSLKEKKNDEMEVDDAANENKPVTKKAKKHPKDHSSAAKRNSEKAKTDIDDAADETEPVTKKAKKDS